MSIFTFNGFNGSYSLLYVKVQISLFMIKRSFNGINYICLWMCAWICCLLVAWNKRLPIHGTSTFTWMRMCSVSFSADFYRSLKKKHHPIRYISQKQKGRKLVGASHSFVAEMVRRKCLKIALHLFMCNVMMVHE